ncbi:hypothetical protein Tco_1039087 [Tanacetum coccineum]
MSTSKTYQQSLAEAGSETRPPMLERGSYIPWASRFKRFLNRKRENRKWLLKALEDGPYVFRNITPTGSILPRLQEVEDLQGDDLLYYDAKMELTNMILLSIPNEIYNSLMNDLERNNMKFPTVSVNTKFLNSLQPEWLKYVTQVRLAKKLTVDSFDDLFDYLSQFEKLVNTSRAKKLEKSHDPLALVAHTVVQGDRVNIQSRNSGNVGRNIDRLSQKEAILQRVNAITAVEKDIMLGIVPSQGIQPADQNSDDEPSYESAFVSECALETLARNAYAEAAKQQRFAQKVQQQNMTLTSQIEMYKERNRVLENITKDNNYLKEFLEADERAKHVQKQADSQLYRDRDIIRDLEKQRDELNYEETLEEAFKSQHKMNAKMNNPIDAANKQNCWTIDYKQLNALYNDFVPQKESFVEKTCPSSPYTPFVKILETKTMPSELPLINGLLNIQVGFEKLFLLIKQNSKRASMFYTSQEEIALNAFCRDQVKPLLNELLDHFDGFQNLFQRDIKEMKDAFEQNDVYLDEIERQNDLLKDQLLEVSLKHDIELCVLLSHECVDKSLHVERV